MLSIRNGVEEKNKFRLSIIDLQLIYSIHTQCFLLFLICKVLVSIIRDHSANNCSHLINTSLTKNVNANSWNLHDHMHYLVYSYYVTFTFFSQYHLKFCMISILYENGMHWKMHKFSAMLIPKLIGNSNSNGIEKKHPNRETIMCATHTHVSFVVK